MPDGPDVRALRYMAGHPTWRGPPVCRGCAFGHDLADGSGLFYCDLLHPDAGLAVDGCQPPCTGVDWRRRAGAELAALVDDSASLAVLAVVARDAREESSMYARGLAEGAAAEREACCRAVCPDCAAGVPVWLAVTLAGCWRHGREGGTRPCKADAIRRRAGEDGR